MEFQSLTHTFVFPTNVNETPNTYQSMFEVLKLQKKPKTQMRFSGR